MQIATPIRANAPIECSRRSASLPPASETQTAPGKDIMQRPKTKPLTSFERDRRRGLITFVCLSVALVVAVVAGGAAAKRGGSSNATAGSELASGTGAGDLQSGAILFVPIEGNVCRRRAIDNDTWHTRNDGYVTCDEAVTWNSGAQGQKYFVTVRVDAIRAGFKAPPR
jgi:hypothetical protein